MIPLSDNIRSRSTPYVTLGIIATCVLVFLYELLNPQFVEEWAFRPAYLLSRELLAIGPVAAFQHMLVSVFLHGGFLHIGGNMLFLWVFGDNVEDRMGHARFLIFYLFAGIVATLVHSFSALLGLLSNPGALDMGVVGASGAIAGVLGAYLVLLPGSQIRTLVIFIFITVINIPAPFFIIVWFVMQLLPGLSSLGAAGTGVAYWAHIGGFGVGYILARRMAGRPRKLSGPRVIDLDIEDL